MGTQGWRHVARRRLVATATVLGLGLGTTLAVPLAEPAAAAHNTTSVTVPYIVQGQTRTITVKGTDFSDLPTLAVEITPSTGISVLSTTFVDSTTVTAQVATTGSATLGAHDVTVVEAPSVDEDTCTGCLSITRAGGISPVALSNSSDGTITVTGVGFNAGVAGVQLLAPGVAPLDATGVSVQSDTTLTATLPILGAAPVRYVVEVDLTAGSSLQYGDTVSDGFAVTAAGPPTLSTASPQTLGQGVVSRTVRLTGTNLARAATITTDNPGITVGSATWVSPTAYDVVVSVAGGSTTGAVDVTLTNANGQAAVCTDCLTVTAKPTVTSSTPNSGGQNGSRTVTIAGTGFESTIAASGLVVSGTGVSVSSLTWVSATQLSATLAITQGAATGARNLTVTNPDGGSGSCTGCFTVTAAPVVSLSNPSAAHNTQTALAVTISGSGFDNTGGTLAAALVRSGQTDIPLTGLGVTATEITGTVNLGMAAPGAWSIRVVNANGGTGTCASCFSVSGSTPTVVAVSPTSVAQGTAGVSLSITGTNFANGDTVTFGTGVTPDAPPTVIDGTHLTVFVTVAPGAPVGATSVRVDHPGAQSGTSCASCLAVNAAPTVSAVSAGLYPGASGVTRTLTGTNLQDGATVTISGSGVTLDSPATFVSATQLTLTLSASGGAATGARDVVVTNPDGGSATCAGCLVVAPIPTLDVAPTAPASRVQGVMSQSIVISGTGFQAGATVAFSGTGVTIDGTPTVGAGGTTLTTSVAVIPGATTGFRDITVTNPDGGSVTASNAFTISAASVVERFVTSAYLDTLGRLPDRGGFDFFLSQIQGGAPRSTVVDNLLRSNEGRRLHHRSLRALPAAHTR